MVLPGIISAEGGVDAPLRGHGMAANGMDFGDERDIKIGGNRHSGPHAGEARADDQDVMNFLNRSQYAPLPLLYARKDGFRTLSRSMAHDNLDVTILIYHEDTLDEYSGSSQAQ